MASQANKGSFRSVSEMLHGTFKQDEGAITPEEFDEYAAARRVTSELVILRNHHGLSQAQMAAKLNCSQSRVSKLENGKDDDLNLGDVRKYMDALGLELVIGGKKLDGTIADEIKQMTVGIRKRLNKLAELADESDAAVCEGISRFYFEAFYNLNKILADACERLPKRPGGQRPFIKICFDGVDEVSEDKQETNHSCSDETCGCHR